MEREGERIRKIHPLKSNPYHQVWVKVSAVLAHPFRAAPGSWVRGVSAGLGGVPPARSDVAPFPWRNMGSRLESSWSCC